MGDNQAKSPAEKKQQDFLAQLAYQDAERRISEANEDARTELDLRISNLSELPPSITTLKSLIALELADTNVSDLSSLLSLKKLRRLNLTSALVVDEKTISKLLSIERLYLGYAAISDAQFLSNLATLKALFLHHTSISDVSGLGNLLRLTELTLGFTNINDLSPLKALSKLTRLTLQKTRIADLHGLEGHTLLKTLELRDTAISDLRPLASLTALETLDLRNTKIADISFLRSHTRLQSLDIRGTKVSDLRPLANAVGLIDGGERLERMGLNFHGRKFQEPLKGYARLLNPNRSASTINYLREQLGLPPYKSRGKKKQSPQPPPSLPNQGIGPHFISTAQGVVDFAPPDSFDEKTGNVSRLRSLHGPLRDAAKDLSDSLAKRGNHYPHLAEAARRYATEIAKDIQNIDFSILYALGLRIEVAKEASQRDINNGISPPFDTTESLAFRNLSLMHGPFVLASNAGQELVTDAERFVLRRADIDEIRENTISFGKSLEQRPEIIAPRAAEFITLSAEGVGQGPHPERGTSLTLHAVANLTVTVGELAIALVLVKEIGVGGMATAAGAWAYLKTRPDGREALKTAETILSKLHASGVETLKTTVPKLLLNNREYLRRLEELSPRFQFVGRLLDWLEQNSDVSAQPHDDK